MYLLGGTYPPTVWYLHYSLALNRTIFKPVTIRQWVNCWTCHQYVAGPCHGQTTQKFLWQLYDAASCYHYWGNLLKHRTLESSRLLWSTLNKVNKYSNTHTHPFNGPFVGLPRWAGTRKVKPIWILLKQWDSEWQWHQLGKSAPHCIRYDTRCYFNVRSKADISQLNLPHGTDN